MKLSYRTEIDGLRAIAIFIVVIYHAEIVINNTHLFQGGYIGVDVFFVISGYLITAIVLRQLQDGVFSFKRFYEKRARRILPALYTIMLISIPFAWSYLYPKALKEYAGSALSTLVSISNFWFWQEDSYSSEASMLKPFLHTWSLSIEEQFYLVFPLLLFLVFKFRKQHIIIIFSIIFLFSIQLAHYLIDKLPDAVFYLLPTRAWELLAGVLVAKLEFNFGRTNNSIFNEFMPLLGIFLILFAAFFFDNSTKHPSFFTLIPVIGTTLFIWYAKEGEFVTKILQSRIFVGIGLISYSLYLWHWIIFSSINILGGTPTIFLKAVYILLAILLATLTYFLIEKPFRFKLSRKVFWICIGSATVLIASINVYIYSHDGIEERLKGIQLTAYKEFSTVEYRRLESTQLGLNLRKEKRVSMCNMRDPNEACKFGNGKFITLGDSFVGHYETALKRRIDTLNEGLISLNYEQCPYVSSDIWFGNVPECPIVNEKRDDLINSFDEQKIFLISANEDQFYHPKKRTKDPLSDGRQNFNGGDEIDSKKAYQAYKNKIQFLLQKGHIVVMIFSLPKPDLPAKNKFFQIINKRKTNDYNSLDPIYIKKDDTYEKAKKIDNKLEISNHPNLLKIYPNDILCNNPEQQCLLISKHGSIYNGGRHLSVIGADMIITRILKELKSRNFIND
ncbi:acyltransferase family protein [Campylobacterota bacterium]